MTFLSISDLSFREEDHFMVNHVSFSVEQGEQSVIAGETGSGKTTLLKMMAGQVQPTSGDTFFKGQRILGPYEKLLPGHPAIGYLSQHYELRNNYRVEEELEAKNLLSEKEAAAIYELCRISHLLKRKTSQLSGGEKQRIALARILITSPQLLLLDEPYSNLDSSHKKIMRSVVEDISKNLGVTCIMVLHDPGDILSWANRLMIMKAGKIIQDGNPEQIYYHPMDAYSAGLLGDYNEIHNRFFRPEQIHISSDTTGDMSGIIQEIHFRGGYYTADVHNGRSTIRVQIDPKKWKIGDEVTLIMKT